MVTTKPSSPRPLSRERHSPCPPSTSTCGCGRCRRPAAPWSGPPVLLRAAPGSRAASRQHSARTAPLLDPCADLPFLDAAEHLVCFDHGVVPPLPRPRFVVFAVAI